MVRSAKQQRCGMVDHMDELDEVEHRCWSSGNTCDAAWLDGVDKLLMAAWHLGKGFRLRGACALMWCERDSCVRGDCWEYHKWVKKSHIERLKRKVMIYKSSGLLLLLPIGFRMKPHLCLLPWTLVEVAPSLDVPNKVENRCRTSDMGSKVD